MFDCKCFFKECVWQKCFFLQHLHSAIRGAAATWWRQNFHRALLEIYWRLSAWHFLWLTCTLLETSIILIGYFFSRNQPSVSAGLCAQGLWVLDHNVALTLWKSLFWASPRGFFRRSLQPKNDNLFVGYWTRCRPSGISSGNCFIVNYFTLVLLLRCEEEFLRSLTIQCSCAFKLQRHRAHFRHFQHLWVKYTDFCAQGSGKSVSLYFCVTPGRLCAAIAAADYSTWPDGFGSAWQAGDLCPLFVPAGNSHR